MKKLIQEFLFLLFLFISITSCQKEDDSFEEFQTENLETVQDSGKNTFSKSSEERICRNPNGGFTVPPGYRITEIFFCECCPQYQGFKPNSAYIERDNTPKIFRAGAGCNDNYCIWIVGDNFEPNAYVDIRTTTGQTIIGTYRGSNRVQYTNNLGQDVITLRLASSLEKREFASRGLRIWVVNPKARKWADGRTVRRPRDVIDPPCNPICP